MKYIRIVFTISLVLATISGYIGTAAYLLTWSTSESQILVPAIVFTLLVGGLMGLVLSIVARVTLGCGLRSISQAAAFRVQYWTLEKNVKQGERHRSITME